jgi:rare lipoprotein A
MTKNNEHAFWGKSAKWLVLCLISAMVASCGTTQTRTATYKRHGKEYFSEKEYGVKASPRLFTGRNIPKGGGRDITGQPYLVKGKWYYPKEDKQYNKVGMASWYGSAFHGRQTANGEVYDQYSLTAAHPTFPLPSYARVTNLKTGDSVIVRVNDRGPYHPGRIIDLSNKAADMLDVAHHGTAMVRVQYVGRARMDGRDGAFLMASYTHKGGRLDRYNPNGEIATGVMVATTDRKFQPKETYSEKVDVQSTATALQSTPLQASEMAISEITEFAALPEIGPVPLERPQIYEHTLGTLSAYADAPVDRGDGPFAAILKRPAKLDADTVRAAAHRMYPGLD